ncbi:hypothetical protein [Mycolicibacterium psychrotolerans]|uniref:DUF732 domain-containing protein n=1 Tax=Mycolicibacterium psychrotolerans TaxID=216929 RepID=A0A7I7MBS4_9MYCO|nr:hypothetical protein [Mycolicibacterium psychrotolerans]BBX69714.1 hypothetical protein MPSYJ_31750 [Mycolicibacterium psychrotolerans]
MASAARAELLAKSIAVAAGTSALSALALTGGLAHADGPRGEQQYIQATSHLPMYVMPDRVLSDEKILAGGYRACEVMDQFPKEPFTAAVVYFHGGNTVDNRITDDGWRFMTYASMYLCERHARMYVGD